METFQDAGLQMLREFRALLQQTPLPIGCTRFLQLLALNMFAIENTQLKGKCHYLFHLFSFCISLQRIYMNLKMKYGYYCDLAKEFNNFFFILKVKPKNLLHFLSLKITIKITILFLSKNFSR